jgi:voltage-gated potassium channel
VGRSLADARIPQETGLIVLALRRHNDEGPAVFNPGGDTRLESGDVMIVLGQPEQVSRLRKYAAR